MNCRQKKSGILDLNFSSRRWFPELDGPLVLGDPQMSEAQRRCPWCLEQTPEDGRRPEAESLIELIDDMGLERPECLPVCVVHLVNGNEEPVLTRVDPINQRGKYPDVLQRPHITVRNYLVLADLVVLGGHLQ